MSQLSEGQKINTIKLYLRRNKTLAEIKILADAVWADASETVTFTATSIEGANASGQITLDRLTYLTALEELIASMDDTTKLDLPSRSIGVRARWSENETDL